MKKRSPGRYLPGIESKADPDGIKFQRLKKILFKLLAQSGTIDANQLGIGWLIQARKSKSHLKKP